MASTHEAEPDDEAAWSAVRAARRGAAVPAALGAHPLCRVLLPVARQRSIVIAQLGQSLDGRIATVTGASHFINGPGAIDHLHRLRALVDAVVVGVGTVAADDCRLTVRRVDGQAPARVVIDPGGRIPAEARFFADDGVRRIVIRAEGSPHAEAQGVETIHIRRVAGRLPPDKIVAALARRGMRRLLVEGGAETVSSFMSARALDRLHVMVAPLIIGSGRPGLMLPPVADLDRARRPLVTAHPLPGGDVVFDCDMRRDAALSRNREEGDNERGEQNSGARRLLAGGETLPLDGGGPGAVHDPCRARA